MAFERTQNSLAHLTTARFTALFLFAIAVSAVQASAKGPATGVARHAAGDLQAITSNGSVVVAVGGAATVLTSADSGRSWSATYLDHSASLIDVTACPDKSFAALDFYHGVWLGDAHGQSWQRVALSDKSAPMAITCAPNGSLWVVGSYSTIQSSSDHGKTWHESDFGEDAILTAIQFIDSDKVMIEGEFGMLQCSIDGGASWTPLPRVPGDFYPFDGIFKTWDEGWLTGRGGRILHTSDGGQSWSEEPGPITGVPLYRFAGGAGERLFGVGELGVISERVDGQWRVVGDHPLGGYLRGAYNPSKSSTLVVVGGAGAETPKSVDLADPK